MEERIKKELQEFINTYETCSMALKHIFNNFVFTNGNYRGKEDKNTQQLTRKAFEAIKNFNNNLTRGLDYAINEIVDSLYSCELNNHPIPEALVFTLMCNHNVPIDTFNNFDYTNSYLEKLDIALKYNRPDVVLHILIIINNNRHNKFLPINILSIAAHKGMRTVVKYIMETELNPFPVISNEEYLTLVYLIWTLGCFDTNNKQILGHMKFIINHMIKTCHGKKCILLEQLISLYVKNNEPTDKFSCEMYLFLSNSHDNNNTMAENIFLQYKDIIGEFWMEQYKRSSLENKSTLL
jgi:hypothetical protein